MSAGYEPPGKAYREFDPLRFPPCACEGCRRRAALESQAPPPTEPVPAPEQPRYVRCPMLGCGRLHPALPDDPG
ncbi:hypothetical protein KQH42_16630 [Streptomyces sp. CHA1]|jgi:hypothetical protein|uniref:Uncharacterized protein n=3 Tax=Streptomyces TaxID=1883 RepID=A0ACC7Y3Z6_9ACTN|nr:MULTISPECIES: hypothetical protein [Streptomyces]AWL33049.1 hypothetical protein B9S66_13060 [Streptomyces sp. SM17]MBT2888105.1 hypothetical protein [Streptomyces sp. McG5]MYQ71624.1 hypothetical protein [Streptomyces sp. SID4934]MYX51514.1 hypothetical protein [Streptomyces sp. SID8385]MYX87489.1 hypothetical protein [Streptomyces sp. SID4915]NEE32829.1 hypothetical protein [Streptomyces sp. SID7982]NEE47718.1 hypothetical protein [Streptomyces sp. SID8455]NUV76565.1 hypothetical prote